MDNQGKKSKSLKRASKVEEAEFLSVSDQLTQSEIESLRKDKKETNEYAKKAFASRRNKSENR
jgi:hypothetical protein